MEGLDTGEGYAVRDIGLAEEGSLESIGLVQECLFLLHFEEAERTKPLAGMRVAGCLHVTKKPLFWSKPLPLQVQNSPGLVAIHCPPKTMLRLARSRGVLCLRMAWSKRGRLLLVHR